MCYRLPSLVCNYSRQSPLIAPTHQFESDCDFFPSVTDGFISGFQSQSRTASAGRSSGDGGMVL